MRRGTAVVSVSGAERDARMDDEGRRISCPSLSTGRFVRACVDIVRDDGFEKHRSFVGSNERCLLLVCRVIPNVQTRVTRRPVVVNLIISHTL